MSDAQQVFNELAARYGGVSALSPIDTELIAGIAKAVAELQAGGLAEAAQIADAIDKLLRSPAKVDLTSLTDEQLAAVERAAAIMDGEPDPDGNAYAELKTRFSKLSAEHDALKIAHETLTRLHLNRLTKGEGDDAIKQFLMQSTHAKDLVT